MNFREGMRRVGIVLGVAGSAVGVMFGYDSALHLWNARVAHRRFEALMSSATLIEAAKAIKAFDTEEWKKSLRSGAWNSVEVNLHGIKDVIVDNSARIYSIELSTGETVSRTDSPTLAAVMAMLLFPVGGFLIPWGAIQVLVWLGVGFFPKSPPTPI